MRELSIFVDESGDFGLLAVDGPTNSRKGAGDAVTWLPPKKSFCCAYVARQVSVKATYGLWVTQAEHDAIARILASCPNEPAVTSAFAPAAPVAAAPEPAPEPAQPSPVAAPDPAPAPAPPPAPAPSSTTRTARRCGLRALRRFMWEIPGIRGSSIGTGMASAASDADAA